MIPQLLLEEINLGEKRAQDYYEKYGKEELEKALADLRKSDEEILKSYPIEEMQLKFANKEIKEEKEERVHQKNVFGFKSYRAWTMSAAAVLAVFLSVPLVINSLKANQKGSVIRVKGNDSSRSQIRLYRQEADKVVQLKTGDKASENDVIQITYTPGNKNYGVIFSFDGNGNITRHFPEESWTAGKLEKTGEEVPLSFSYALDDAPEYECFVFVAGKEEFSLDEIEKAAKENTGIRSDYFKRGKYFPKNSEANVFILEK